MDILRLGNKLFRISLSSNFCLCFENLYLSFIIIFQNTTTTLIIYRRKEIKESFYYSLSLFYVPLTFSVSPLFIWLSSYLSLSLTLSIFIDISQYYLYNIITRTTKSIRSALKIAFILIFLRTLFSLLFKGWWILSFTCNICPSVRPLQDLLNCCFKIFIVNVIMTIKYKGL